MSLLKTGYKAQAEDTHPESDRVFFALLRQRGNADRLLMASGMIHSARRLSLTSLKHNFSHLASQDFAQKVALAWLQEDCPAEFTPAGNEMTWIQDSIGLAGLLHPIFEESGIPYYITGGVAAIAYGEPRTTRDLDAVVSVSLVDVPRLVQVLEAAGFYVPGVLDVVSSKMKSLSITHIESISRADLILSPLVAEDEFEALKFQRRRLIEVPGTGSLFFSSAEDVILSKLDWGRHTQSEKQWRDVLGVLKVQGETLDFQYLAEWSNRLKISNRLDRARVEAGV